MPVPPYDYLDSMMWNLVAIGVLTALYVWKMPYNPSKNAFNDGALARAFSIPFGIAGFYLALTGLMISFTWPFPMSGGIYNVLFGGSASLGGLVIIAFALANYFNYNLRPITYIAAVVGLYIIVDGIAILQYRLTRTPELSAALFIVTGIAAILSILFTHSENKALRYTLLAFVIIFTALWLFEAVNVTIGHLAPPPPT
jgi:putative membrane protein